MTILERVKLLLNITDTSKDALLGELIDKAEKFALNYTNNPNCLEDLGGTLIDMVIFDYDLNGSEGLKSENYSGASFNYKDRYGDDIMGQLKKKRKIGVIRHDD